MGVELHITRAEFWAMNEVKEISAEEWLSYVSSDSELKLRPENGAYFVEWLGESKYDEPWFDWFQGNINTKWPDTAIFQKMLFIAAALDGQVQDDEGKVYIKIGDWEFDPDKKSEIRKTPAKTVWWKKLLSI